MDPTKPLNYLWWSRWGYMAQAKLARVGKEKWAAGQSLSGAETDAVLWAREEPDIDG